MEGDYGEAPKSMASANEEGPSIGFSNKGSRGWISDAIMDLANNVNRVLASVRNDGNWRGR